MRRPLALAALLGLIASTPSAWGETDGYGGWRDVFDTDTLVGAGVGENLYEKIDRGGYAAETAFYAQALEGSARDLNAKVTQEPGLREGLCGADQPTCRVFVRDLDADATAAVANGELGPVLAALNPAAKGRLTSDNLARLATIARDYAASKRTTVDAAARQAQALSMIGLYVDGDVDNSDYDIVTDVEKVNKRLFGAPPVYSGPANRSGGAFRDLLSGPFQGGSNVERLDDGATGALASTGFAYKDAAARNCPSPAWSGALVDEVNALLDPQGPGAAAWEGADPLAGAGLSTGMPLAKPNGAGDCGNDEFYCIDVQFLTYQQDLFGYGGKAGKDASLESVVDKHLKHISAQAGKSFVQTTNATNFAQLPIAGNLKGYLAENVSFKVEVNYLPPPFLASKGLPKETATPTDWTAPGALETGLSRTSGGDMGIANLVTQAFQAEGLGADPSRVNLLFLNGDDLKERMTVNMAEGGTFSSAAFKADVLAAASGADAAAKAVQDVAADTYLSSQSFRKLDANLNEVSSFASALRHTVDTLTNVIHAMAKKSN